MNTVTSIFAALILSLSPGLSAQTIEKPNILLILIDDMGYPAIGCYGNKMVATPHIDKIAEKGVRFTQGYACPQYGFPYARVKEPEYLEDLPREQFTVAEALKTAGYTTAILGKWHLSTFDNDGYYTYLYPEKGLHFAEYLTSIEHLDNSVGRLNAKLPELGIEKNT